MAKKLIEGAIAKTDGHQQRAALAFCLAQLAMDPQTYRSSGSSLLREPSPVADVMDIAKHMDKETDRACSALQGKALGVWLWLAARAWTWFFASGRGQA